MLRSTLTTDARKRGLEWDLSDDELERLVKGDCHYCGAPPRLRTFNGGKYATLMNGIDRIDSSLGYYEGNCLSCCPDCNRAKMALGYEEFLELVNRIAQRHPREVG
jgi:hypothetical protein